MSDPNAKNGPLTQDDLQAIWLSAVDATYSQPFIEAGEGQGFEAYTQAFAQLARVSEAIDITTQAMFVKPWSGQSNPSAGGAQAATVTLTFQRTGFIDRPLRLAAGIIFVQEQETDWGQGGGVLVLTGRRFFLTEDVIFLPGEMGPFDVVAQAENPGYGYNNPQPDTISVITQNGSAFNNNLATVNVTPGNAPPPPALQIDLIAFNEADMFIPDHVGQYAMFTAGNNNGNVARVTTFLSPSLPNGSSVFLEDFVAAQSESITGTFTANEVLLIKNGGTTVGYGQFLVTRPDNNGNIRIGFLLTQGTFDVGDTLTGVLSGATSTITSTIYNPTFVSEAPINGAGGATWRMMDWVIDWGIAITHEESPSGGRSAMLDELGQEKNLPRAPGETDAAYAARQANIADVVTPNAIKRVLNTTLDTLPWCFREVGSALLPGFYYDRDDENGDFYDYDTIVFTGTVTSGSFLDPGSQFQEPVQFQDSSGNAKSHGYFGRIDGGVTFTFIREDGQGTISNPAVIVAGDRVVGMVSGAIFTPSAVVATPSNEATRFHVYLDYTDFRAMFMVGVQPSDEDDLGFAYDDHPRGAYDAAPFADFYDGVSAGNLAQLKQLWQNVDRIRAGGVTFYLYLEDGTCT